jgi:hypothetical protein
MAIAEIKEQGVEAPKVSTANLDGARAEAFARPQNLKAADAKGSEVQEKQFKSPEQIKEEALKAAKDIMKAAKDGKWSDEAKEGWNKVFKDIAENNNNDPKRVAAGLNEVGAAINKQLEASGSKNRVGMAVLEDKDGTRFHMTVSDNAKGNREKTTAAVLDNKDTPNVINVGTVKAQKK